MGYYWAAIYMLMIYWLLKCWNILVYEDNNYDECISSYK